MTSEKLVERLPLTFTDTPDYAEVRDAQGTLIALTTDPAFFTRLQQALAAAEARIAAKDEALQNMMAVVRTQNGNLHADINEILAAGEKAYAMTSASLPALLAETRKKALEEAAAHLKAKADEMRGTPIGTTMAAIFDEQAAAIRALAEEVRT